LAFFGILPLILQQFPKTLATLGFTGALVVSLLGVELCYNKISLFLRKPAMERLSKLYHPRCQFRVGSTKAGQRQIAQVLYEKLLPGQRC